MSSGEIIPTDPASLAAEANEKLFYAPDNWLDDETHEVRETLEYLGTMARTLDFTDRDYLVTANRALTIPEKAVGGKVHESVTYGNLYDLAFRGTFSQYAKVQIGWITGGGSIRAYCLLFNEVKLVPENAGIPEDRLFFVPALAVKEIDAL